MVSTLKPYFVSFLVYYGCCGKEKLLFDCKAYQMTVGNVPLDEVLICYYVIREVYLQRKILYRNIILLFYVCGICSLRPVAPNEHCPKVQLLEKTLCRITKINFLTEYYYIQWWTLDSLTRTMVLNRVVGTEPRKFHKSIHRTLHRTW